MAISTFTEYHIIIWRTDCPVICGINHSFFICTWQAIQFSLIQVQKTSFKTSHTPEVAKNYCCRQTNWGEYRESMQYHVWSGREDLTGRIVVCCCSPLQVKNWSKMRFKWYLLAVMASWYGERMYPWSICYYISTSASNLYPGILFLYAVFVFG